MNKYHILFLLATSFLIISCENNKKPRRDIINDSTTSDIHSKQEDTATVKFIANNSDSLITDRDTIPVLNVTEDYIKQYPGNQKKEFKRHMEEIIKKWKDIPNPITATYKGNDFGDYHHIIFEDTKGVSYDFGQAKNNYGAYKLHETTGQYEDNPKFLRKKFNVYWDWKLAKFLCCDGDYGKAEAYLPTITKLELIKN